MAEADQKYVEVTKQYMTVVDSIDEALAFIVVKIDAVGPYPSVHIHPAQDGPPAMLMMLTGQEPVENTTRFQVVVEGTTQEPRTTQSEVED